MAKTQNDYAYQQLVQADADKVATGMFLLLDRLQTTGKPGEQVAAAAILMVLVAQRFGVDPHEATSIALRIIRQSDHATRGQQFDAARDYLNNEVK
ncbi:hypothetical protein UFOVP823_3 [uncultured Caudovirales phage]|uniref:Uncharacterized protein n=1 Tax=uncultured Caudovirales phage TaxID=2100421 RepID=A0A6J5P1Q2_9CAUD|nr:hypothetical protein UFOVP823_3 [uncultured Caudovirales phage]